MKTNTNRHKVFSTTHARNRFIKCDELVLFAFLFVAWRELCYWCEYYV